MDDKSIEITLDELKADVKQMAALLEKICKVLSLERVEQEELINLKEAANFMKMPEREIVSKCNKGELPFLKRGRGLKFRRSELLDWIQNRSTEMEGSIDEYVSRYLQQNPLKGY